MHDKILTALDRYRNGDDDGAISILQEIDGEMLSALAEIYRAEEDPDMRAFIVRIAWERREPATVDFIVEALNDPAEEVWQSALDGTVALASPEILDILKSLRAADRPDPARARRFQACLDEAILYVDGLLQRG